MRLIAHYDADGTIHSVLRIDAPDGISVMVAPEPGLLVGELDDAGFEADDGSVEMLDSLIRDYRVMPMPRLILARRGD